VKAYRGPDAEEDVRGDWQHAGAEQSVLLRTRALEVLGARPGPGTSDHTLQELEVHQIELELQKDELLRAQGDLESSRKRYFELYHKAPIGYCLVTERGLIEEANLKASEMFGLLPEELTQHSLIQLVHRDDRDLYHVSRKVLFETGQPQTLELRLLDRGRTFWAQLMTSLTQGADGDSVCRIVLQDISLRKAAEEDLIAQKELLDITLRSIQEGVITTNAQGTVRLMNHTAERLCGWTESEAWGQPIDEVFLVFDEQSRLPMKRSLAQNAVLESRIGTQYNIEASTSVIQNPVGHGQGHGQGQVLVFRDVTGELRLREQLQQTEKIEALGVLAGGLTHDFNNLLGVIFGYMSLAKASLPDPDATLEYLDKAGASFNKAKALTMGLTTFSKGGNPLRKTGRLPPLIRGAGTFVLTGSNISVDYSFSEDLGLCDFDGAQMSQVFTRLITNSKQAMPMGGTIRISAHNTELVDGEVPPLPPGDYLKVSVSDHGEGIPHNLFRKVFDPFFTTRETNQGLGLSTCLAIVQKHGGAITVQSEPGQGTSIHVFLPASLQDTPNMVIALGPPPADLGTILLMDDEPFMREIVRNMLKSLGYEVIEAASGEEALQLAAHSPEIQAAIIDLTVSEGMDGKRTLDEIRRLRPGLPVFAVSGFPEDPIMAHPNDFGFTDSVTKPFQMEDLARVMGLHLRPL